MSDQYTLFSFLVLVSLAIAIWLVCLTILTEQHMRALRLDVLRMHDDWLHEFTKKDEEWSEEFLEELWEEDAP